MPPKRDLTGQKFGSLTVIAEAGRYKNGNVLWKCLCDCGKESIVSGGHLKHGDIKSCGHCYTNTYRMSDDMSYMIMTFPNGTEFLIDSDDYEKLKAYTWNRTNFGYASTRINGKATKLHRFLMNAPDDKQVDHINLNRYDNRKSNLRLATDVENKRNKGPLKNNSSGVKGVCYRNERKKYRAYICVDRRQIHLGYYNTLIEAARAYNQAALRYFGEFAWLNDLSKITPDPVFSLLPGKEKVTCRNAAK